MHVQPSVNNIAVMPLDVVANAILPSDHSLARIRLIRAPVPPVAFKNNIPPSSLLIIEQKRL